jgi:hypothetical protein
MLSFWAAVRRAKMRKLLITVIMLAAVTGCSGMMPAKADEPKDLKVKELKTFCETKSTLLQKLIFEAVDDNHQLHDMIREDVGDFVPVLFAQFKMETLSILLYSTLVEVLRTAEDGEVFNITFNLLDQYIELIGDSMIKAKLFEGMIGDPNSRWIMSRNQLILRKVTANLEAGYDLLVDIKKGLEELK